MNKIFVRLRKIVVSLFIIIGLVTAGNYMTIQFVEGEGDEKGLAQQIKRLANSIHKFAEALNPPKEEELVETEFARNTTVDSTKITACLQKIGGLPSSLSRNKNEVWSAKNFPPVNYIFGLPANYLSPAISQFVDLNGDGLIDYFYSKNRVTKSFLDWDNSTQTNTLIKYTPENSCVLMNNGRGWDIVYQCVVLRVLLHEYGPSKRDYELRYFGDCAYTSGN